MAIVDRYGKLLPCGIEGQIYIAGIGLANSVDSEKKENEFFDLLFKK